MEKKKVMVAIDESETSLYALKWALENLRESMRDSKVFIFTAQPMDDMKYIYASAYGSAPPELVEYVRENHRKVAESLLEDAKGICEKSGVTAETFTEPGDPKDTICKAVDDHEIELLVVGSHGRKAIQRAFLGSVSSYCVHNAKCPVLVVRKKH